MYKDLLQPLIDISREVGQFLKKERLTITASEIEFKSSARDLVSRADKEAEQRFVAFLEKLLPEAGFIAEEDTRTHRGDRYNWVIDPLDGTTNYLHGIYAWCTSVALMDGDEIVLGVIYDPEHDELFSASKSGGAFLNGKSIFVTGQSKLTESFMATGFPYDNRGKQKVYLDILGRVNTKTRGIRRLGSAALDLAYVACGRFDGFYEYGLNPWDMAAGALLVTEAGGKITNFSGNDDYLFGPTMLCSNGILQEEFLNLMEGWE